MNFPSNSMPHNTDKPDGYFGQARDDLVDFLPADPQARILEIGCGEGATGALAKRRGKCQTYIGIELDPGAADRARKALDLVIEGDVERIDFTQVEAPFDAVILSEILEHLVDPWAMLARLKPLMAPGALILASSPNVSHHKIIRSLLGGKFEYQASGPMDRTHLRWFTPHSYRQLFEQAGFETISLKPLNKLGWKGRLLQRLTLGRTSHLVAAQLDYVGRLPA